MAFEAAAAAATGTLPVPKKDFAGVSMKTAAKTKLRMSRKLSTALLEKAAAAADHFPKKHKRRSTSTGDEDDIFSGLSSPAVPFSSGLTSPSNGQSLSPTKRNVRFIGDEDNDCDHSSNNSSSLSLHERPLPSYPPKIVPPTSSSARSSGHAYTSPSAPPPSRGMFSRSETLTKMKSIRAPADKAELIRLESFSRSEDDEEGIAGNALTGARLYKCDVCQLEKDKGVLCDSLEHFICRSCFAGHVESLCRDTKAFKTSKSAICCPCGGCTAAPWNSYHMRKILTNGYDNVLELYLSTMMTIMQELSFARLSTNTNTTSLHASPMVSRSNSSRMGVLSMHAEPTRMVSASTSPGIAAMSFTPQKPTVASSVLSSGNNNTNPVEPVVVIQFSDEAMQAEYDKLVETVKILRKQLMDHNLEAAEYIPLEVLQAELQDIFGKTHRGEAYDEARMDYLLMCLENNPEYLHQKEVEQQQWRAENVAYAQACLVEMRGYIPANIFSATTKMLREDYAMPVDFSKRLMAKKCLWLLRCEPNDIEKLHEADLMGRFTFEAQGLDVVELAALYAAVPEKFSSDTTGRKQNWRTSLELSLKKYLQDLAQGRLETSKKRHPVYKKAVPQFKDDTRLHRLRDDLLSSSIGMSTDRIVESSDSKESQVTSDLVSETAAQAAAAIVGMISSSSSVSTLTDINDLSSPAPSADAALGNSKDKTNSTSNISNKIAALQIATSNHRSHGEGGAQNPRRSGTPRPSLFDVPPSSSDDDRNTDAKAGRLGLVNDAKVVAGDEGESVSGVSFDILLSSSSSSPPPPSTIALPSLKVDAIAGNGSHSLSIDENESVNRAKAPPTSSGDKSIEFATSDVSHMKATPRGSSSMAMAAAAAAAAMAMRRKSQSAEE